MTATRLIPLTKGKHAIVDEADFEWLSQWKWSLHGRGYASRQTGGRAKRVSVMMHRLIAETPEGMDTDHINGDKLDNRRSNLRHATRGQNNVNRSLLPSNSTGYKGVRSPLDGRNGLRWPAFITVDNKAVGLGSYSTPEEAARAVDIAAFEAFGEFAQLNFPDRMGEPAPQSRSFSAGQYLPAEGTQARTVYDCILTHESALTVREVAMKTGLPTKVVAPAVRRLVKFGQLESFDQPAKYQLPRADEASNAD